MGFDEKVWLLLQRIPRGKVATYKSIASALGKPNAARAVGSACSRNPNAPKVPCHRVVKSSGELGGYSFGAREKMRLLEKEGLRIKNNKVIGFSERLFEFRK